MKLLKYDKYRDVNGMSITAITNAVTNNVSSNIFGNGGSNNSSSHTENRTLWGQYDEGDDLDGSMTVNGNITIKAIVARSYEPDDDADGEDIEEEEGGGNLSVEGSIEAFDIDIKNAYARNHLYVNYPHPNGTKQCVVDLIKTNADNVYTNKTNITNLTNTVNNFNSTITELNSTIITLSNRIKTLEDNQCKCDGLTEARVIELIKQYGGNSGSGSGSETPDPTPTSNYRIVVYVHNAGDNIGVNAYLFDSNEEPVLDDYDNRYTPINKVEDAAGTSTIVFNKLIPQSPLSLDVNTRGGIMKTIGRNEDFKVYLKINGLWYNAGEFTLEAHKSYPVNHTLYG